MSTTRDDATRLEAPGKRSLWRNRDYVLLWCGQAISEIGSSVSSLAFPLLVLAVTGSPAQAGIVAAQVGRAKAKPLHHAGPETLDKAVRFPQEAAHRCKIRVVLEIERQDVGAAPSQDVLLRRDRRRPAGALDPHHLGAMIGQHHRRERRGRETRELDDSDAGERLHLSAAPSGWRRRGARARR